MTNKRSRKDKSILDTIGEDQLDFYLRSLRNKTRNMNKQLKEISELEQKSKTEELKSEQLEKISKKEEIEDAKADLNRIANLYIEARNQEKANPTIPGSNKQPKQKSEDIIIPTKTEEVKEDKKDTISVRKAAKLFVSLFQVSTFLRQDENPSRHGLQKEALEELESIAHGLSHRHGGAAAAANNNQKECSLEKSIENFLLNTATQESVEKITQSADYQKWVAAGSSHSKHHASSTSSTVVSAPVNSTPSKAPAPVAPAVVSNEEQKEVTHNTSSAPATAVAPSNATLTTSTTTNSSSVAVPNATSNNAVAAASSSAPAGVTESAKIEDDDDDDSRFQSENEDVQEEPPKVVLPPPAKVPKVVAKKEDDEWIIAGKQKEDTNHHHRPQGVWKERKTGGFERPFNQRRNNNRRQKPEGGEAREPRTEGGVDREKIREDRAKRGEHGDFGQRSNYKRAKESGNVRVPEYVPKDQLKKTEAE